jgi:large subunit ribosomal protein L29
MKAEKMREMSVPELEQMLRELEEEKFNLEFRLSTQKPENPLRIRTVRREMARVRTVLRQNELKILGPGVRKADKKP